MNNSSGINAYTDTKRVRKLTQHNINNARTDKTPNAAVLRSVHIESGVPNLLRVRRVIVDISNETMCQQRSRVLTTFTIVQSISFYGRARRAGLHCRSAKNNQADMTKQKCTQKQILWVGNRVQTVRMIPICAQEKSFMQLQAHQHV